MIVVIVIAALRMGEIGRSDKNDQNDGEGYREFACHRRFLSKRRTELSRNMDRMVYSSAEEFEATGIASNATQLDLTSALWAAI